MSSTVQSAIRRAVETLSAAGVDNPTLDARLLAEPAFKLNRMQMLAAPERLLNDADVTIFEKLIARRAKREPVARILGEREFWGLPFGLNEATLEPRPDSETLVEASLKLLSKTSSPRILDLGTGTGCLLLALLHELPKATGLGIDQAPRAVEQAQKNAERLNLNSRCEFRIGDWLDGITEKFDLVISNPPYIASAEIETLMPEVRNHDPRLALDGGEDGLNPYRLLAKSLPSFLKPDGLIALEVGEGQAQTVEKILRENGFADVALHKDLNGIQRGVTAKRAG